MVMDTLKRKPLFLPRRYQGLNFPEEGYDQIERRKKKKTFEVLLGVVIFSK
jgi:hypothetical protein